MSIKLIPEQLEAVEMIKDAPGPTRLLGAAGMGKSTVINALGNSIPKAAPTNKAASIIGCPTIHKMLGLTIRKQGSKLVTVPTRATPRGKIRSPVVFDEASCIPKDILDTYILPVFTRPIFVGDEAQLNPVTEGGSKPDFFGFLPLILGDYRCPQPFQLTLPVPPLAYLIVRRVCQIFG